MKIEQIKFKATGYNSVTSYCDNYLILNSERTEKYLTFDGIMIQKINKYGKKLINLVPQNILENKDISIGYQKNIFEIIYNYFKNGGFLLSYSNKNYLDSNSAIILSKNDINYLSNVIIKSYIFYKLYNATIYKCEITEEIKEFMEYIHISNISKEILLPQMHNELKQYLSKNKNVKLDLEYYKETNNKTESFSTFSLIFNDWYAFILNNMIYNLLNDISTDKIIICKICGKSTIRITNNQKYCKKCSEDNKKYDPIDYAFNKGTISFKDLDDYHRRKFM